MSHPRASVRPRVRARGVLVLACVWGALCASVAPARGQAQDSVVWVWLEDDAFATDAPVPALSARALERRARHGIPLRSTDAAVPAHVVARLTDAGLRVRHTSRWLRAVSGTATADALDRIRDLDVVARVSPVAVIERPRPVPERAPSASAERRAPPPEFYGESFAQVDQIGVPLAHDLGYTGAGVVVAMLDTGFDPAHRALTGLDVIGVRDFIGGDAVVVNEPGDPPTQDHHGTEVWSVLGGYDPDFFVGPAHGAQFLLAKVDRVDAEPRADEDRWVAALEWADSMGADVVSSSLGYTDFDDGFGWQDEDFNGDTTPTTIAADAAAARGILVVNSAGNQGRGQLGAPADADSIIAVGAVSETGTLATFSSTGPTADGRIKPDLVARGVGTIAAVPDGGDLYGGFHGTSFAAPLVGGAAALVMEAWPQLDAMQVRTALLLSGSAQPPNDSTGHGLPHVASAILFPLGVVPDPNASNGRGGVVRSLTPRFAWQVGLLHAAAAPVRYIVQVAADSTFVSIVAADTVVDETSLTLAAPLAEAESLWWRVVAESAPGVVRTSAVVGPFTMAPWVRLISLNDPAGAQVNDPTPLLVWDPLSALPPVGPLDFDVEVLAAGSGVVERRIAGVADTSVTIVEPLSFNVPYLWRVIARTAVGTTDTAQSFAPFVVVSADAPPVTALYQNFPNPFPRRDTPATTIWFDLHEGSDVELAVYDLRGRLVRRLVPDARQGCGGTIRLEPGTYGREGNPPCVSTTWDGETDTGQRMPPGVYLIRLRTDTESHTVRTLFRP